MASLRDQVASLAQRRPKEVHLEKGTSLRKGIVAIPPDTLPSYPHLFVDEEIAGPHEFARIKVLRPSGDAVVLPIRLKKARIGKQYYDYPDSMPLAYQLAGASSVALVSRVPPQDVFVARSVILRVEDALSDCQGRLSEYLLCKLKGGVYAAKDNITYWLSIGGRKAAVTLQLSAVFGALCAKNVDFFTITARTALVLDAVCSTAPSSCSDTLPVTGDPAHLLGLSSDAKELMRTMNTRLFVKGSIGSALLHGHPGCGKSEFALRASRYLSAQLLSLDVYSASEAVNKLVNQNDKSQALAPTILFFDEIDSLTATESMLSLASELEALNSRTVPVFVLAATNRFDNLTPRLISASVFAIILEFRCPDSSQREELFEHFLGRLTLPTSAIAGLAHERARLLRALEGYTHADVASIFRKAEVSLQAGTALSSQNTPPSLLEAFDRALFSTTPTVLKSLTVVTPDATHEVGGLDTEISFIKTAIDNNAAAILLTGPPGVGKSQIARHLASCRHYNMIAVAATEVVCSYVGETEKKIELIFRSALAAEPCLLFWDEIDVVFPRAPDTGGHVGRAISTFCDMLDALAGRSVFLLSASNRLEAITPSILQRFTRIIDIQMPHTIEKRSQILRVCLKGLPVDSTVLQAIDSLAERMSGYSGADISGAIDRASMYAMRRIISTTGKDSDEGTILLSDFEDVSP